MKKVVVFPLLALLALLLVACGGAATTVPVSHTIEITEYSFTPATLELKVGQQVTLNLVNKGTLQHEIMFGREVMMMDNRPAGYQEDMFAAGGVHPEVTQSAIPEEVEEGHSGFMVVLPVGSQATITFNVTEGMVGDWEMGCFEQDGVHYDAGMKGAVTVVP
jgi:uncharacterized cupredoxin-like copper-binding protein